MSCYKFRPIDGASPLFVAKLGLVLSIGFILSVSSFKVSVAQAEDLRVFPGEYVVEVNAGAFDLGDGSADAALEAETGLSVKKSLGGGAKLIGPQSGDLGALDVSEPVAYDPSDSFCSDALKSGLVSSCSPNFELKIDRTNSNDPQQDSLWGMTSIGAADAWDLSQGASDVVVAIIDTGIDYNHPDLAANVWTNPGEIPGNGVDDDHNGYVDDVHGINAISGSGEDYDDNGHGTHCAGTIGAVGNNGTGVAGVNWRVKMMGLKFLSATGSGSLAAAVTAINYMVMMKNRGVNIRISSNSWGGGGFSQPLLSAIQAANNAGIIFVAAAGNEGANNDSGGHYPANYDVENVVSVAAIGQDHTLASFSNYGVQQVDIAAPGVGILSTKPGGSYQSLSGTSMATPHVSGALALILAHEPDLSNEQLIKRLYESGRSLTSLSGKIRTGRTLDVNRALRNIVAPVPGSSLPECTSSVTEIPYSPDYSADNQAIVLQADENGYYRFELPFVMQFYRQAVNAVYISPNGLVYFADSVPSPMDYRNGETVPALSAGFHTDLVAKANPQGVRVYADGGHATVYWNVDHYSQQGQGSIQLRMTFFPDGTINEYVAIEDAAHAQFVTSRATVGASGPSSDTAMTWKYNTAFASPVGLSFNHECAAPTPDPVTVDSLVLTGKAPTGESKRGQAFRGRRLNIGAKGSGQGAVQVQFSFNHGEMCPGVADIEMVDGHADYATVVPRTLSNRVRTIDVTINGALSRSAQFVRTSESRARGRSKARARQIRADRLERYCDMLMLSLSAKKVK